MSRVYSAALLALLMIAFSSRDNTFASPGITTRISVTPSGEEARGASESPVISANGRFVAFVSVASNTLEGDNDGSAELTLHDLQAGTMELVSVDTVTMVSSQKNQLGISADGRFIAFQSASPNLVEGDNNDSIDVFVLDRRTGTTERVSVDSDGKEGSGQSWAPAISGDGRIVTFASSAFGTAQSEGSDFGDVFAHDRQTGVTEPVSDVTSDAADGGASAVSFDGRFVAFESRVSTGGGGISVRDRLLGTTELVSVNSNGDRGDGLSQHPGISADGRYVVFQSTSYNLAPGEVIPRPENIYVRDRQAKVTEMIGVNSEGKPAAGGFGASMFPAISADGRYVAFGSWATNLVPGDHNAVLDTFVRDRITGTTERVSIESSGIEGNCGSGAPVISGDGRLVAFISCASNLVPSDTNGANDVFLHDPAPQPAAGPTLGGDPTRPPAIASELPGTGGHPPVNDAEGLLPIVGGAVAIGIWALILAGLTRSRANH